jgi:hypothetical protein
MINCERAASSRIENYRVVSRGTFLERASVSPTGSSEYRVTARVFVMSRKKNTCENEGHGTNSRLLWNTERAETAHGGSEERRKGEGGSGCRVTAVSRGSVKYSFLQSPGARLLYCSPAGTRPGPTHSHTVSREFSILEPTRHFSNPLNDIRTHSMAPLLFFPSGFLPSKCLEARDILDHTRSSSFSTRPLVCITANATCWQALDATTPYHTMLPYHQHRRIPRAVRFDFPIFRCCY